MPNKLRVAVDIEGMKRTGGQARSFMRDLIPRRTNLPPGFDFLSKAAQCEWLFERVVSANKRMWIFREPSHVGLKHSRYKQLLQSWGFYDAMGELQRAVGRAPTLGISWEDPATGRRIQANAVNPRRTRTAPVPFPTLVNRRQRAEPPPVVQWTNSIGIDFSGGVGW
jgi:hypothetical protein